MQMQLLGNQHLGLDISSTAFRKSPFHLICQSKLKQTVFPGLIIHQIKVRRGLQDSSENANALV